MGKGFKEKTNGNVITKREKVDRKGGVSNEETRTKRRTKERKKRVKERGEEKEEGGLRSRRSEWTSPLGMFF